MFLTYEELKFLTDHEYAAHQIRWLNQNGFTFVVSAAGRPRVLRSHVELKLGGSKTDVPKSAEPDFSQLLKGGFGGKHP